MEAMPITTVVFDFGNVVGLFSHRRSAEQLAVYGTASAEAIQAYLYGSTLERDYEAGRVPTETVRAWTRETFGLHCTDEQFDRAFADIFTPNREVCDLVRQLHGRYRLMLLSNTNELHARQFLNQMADELAPFDDVILSHEVGLRKPDPRVFQLCEQRARSRAEQMLFIDDLPTNVDGALARGWHGLVYRPGKPLTADLLLNSDALNPNKPWGKDG